MSMEEMDQAMMDMVNSKESADAVPREGTQWFFTGAKPPRNDSEDADRVVKRFELMRKIRMAVWALICIAAAVALIAAQYVPAVLPWVLKIGTICFIVAAAIILDRQLRWRV